MQVFQSGLKTPKPSPQGVAATLSVEGGWLCDKLHRLAMPAAAELERLGQELLDEPTANINHAATLLSALESDGHQEQVLVAVEALKIFFQDSCAKGDLPAKSRKVACMTNAHTPPLPLKVWFSCLPAHRCLLTAPAAKTGPRISIWHGWPASMRTSNGASLACYIFRARTSYRSAALCC